MKTKIIFSLLLFLFAARIGFSQNPQLWGMSSSGGNDTGGTIFKINGDGTGFKNYHHFNNGAMPLGNLFQASDGKFYGMTQYGYGSNNKGVLFNFNPNDSSFTALVDLRSHPIGSLIQTNDGKLWGLGDSIFNYEISSNIYAAQSNVDYGNSLIQATDGKFYGMTEIGGVHNEGVIFSYDPVGGAYTELFDFDSLNGRRPSGNLLQASDGKLYGMTEFGGMYTLGVIFCYDISTSVYTKLYDFNYNDGKRPWGSLIQLSNGKLYGLTPLGGTHLVGVLFSFDPITNIYSVLYNFNSQFSIPEGSLMQASDGKLYGMTWASNGNTGGIFSFDTSNNICTKIFDFNFVNGAYPYGDLIEMDSSLITTVNDIDDRIDHVSIFPNPTENTFTINLKSELRNARIEIFSALGEKVYSTAIIGNQYTVSNKFPSGIYFVKVIDGENNVVKKLVVK